MNCHRPCDKSFLWKAGFGALKNQWAYLWKMMRLLQALSF
jgi:hypothetical protein